MRRVVILLLLWAAVVGLEVVAVLFALTAFAVVLSFGNTPSRELVDVLTACASAWWLVAPLVAWWLVWNGRE